MHRKLSPEFKDLENSGTWANITTKMPFNSSTHDYSAQGVGPFVFFSQGRQTNCCMFVGNWSARFPTRQPDQKIVSLQPLTGNRQIVQLQFKTGREALSFLTYWETMFQKIAVFPAQGRISGSTINGKSLEYFNDGKPKELLSTLQMLQKPYHFQLMDIKCGENFLDIALRMAVTISTLIEVQKKMGGQTKMSECFVISTGSNVYKFRCKAGGENQMMDYVLSLYYFAMQPVASAPAQPKQVITQTIQPVRPPPTPAPAPAPTPTPVPAPAPKPEPKPDPKPAPVEETTVPVPLPVDAPTPPSEIPLEDTEEPEIEIVEVESVPLEDAQTNIKITVEDLSAPPERPLATVKRNSTMERLESGALMSKSMTTTRSSKHEITPVEVDKKAKVKAYDVPEYNDLPKRLVDIRDRLGQRYEPVEFQPPDYKSLLQIAKSSVAVSEHAIDKQLEDILSGIEDDSGSLIASAARKVERTDTEVVNSTLECFQQDADVEVNFDSFFNGDLPRFDLSLFKSSSRPVCHYIPEITKISTELLERADTQSSGKRLAFIIASLFVNGFKNFYGLKSTCSMIPAMNELSETIPDLRSVVKMMEAEDVTVNQASVLGSSMVHNNLVFTVIREIKKRTSWVLTYYNKTSLFSDSSFIEDFLVSLEIMTNHTLMCEPTPLLIAKAPAEDIDRFVTTPALAYLNIDKLDSKDVDAVKEITEQICMSTKKKLVFNMKNLASAGNAMNTTAAWNAISEFKLEQDTSSEWRDFVLAITERDGMKNLLNNFKVSKLERLVAEGIRRRKMHIWFLFISAFAQRDYYYPESTVTDFYRANYVITKIWMYQQKLKESPDDDTRALAA